MFKICKVKLSHEKATQCISKFNEFYEQKFIIYMVVISKKKKKKQIYQQECKIVSKISKFKRQDSLCRMHHILQT